MRKTYGLPYKGSKNRFAEQIVAILPRARHLYDLFAGGGAITHCAMQTNRWEVVHMNDINGAQMQFFADALAGRVKMRAVDREEFQQEKGEDMMAASCWSFGMNGEHYLWNAKIERVKLLAARMLLAETLPERLELYRQFGEEAKRMAYQMIEEKTKVDANMAKVDADKIAAEAEKEATGVVNVDVWAKGNRRTALLSELVEYFCQAKEAAGVGQKQIREILGNNMGSHYFTRGSQWQLPKRGDYERLRELMDLPRPWEELKQEYDDKISGWVESSKNQEWDTFANLERNEAIDNMLRVCALSGEAKRAEVVQTVGDYQDVEILPDSVIYCDIPYIGLRGDCDNMDYNDGEGGKTAFNHERFYEWAERQTAPVFISSYDMPRERFEPVLEIKTICTFAADNANAETWERVFMPKRQAEVYKRAQRLQMELEFEE